MMSSLVQEQATIALDGEITLHAAHHSIWRGGEEIPLSELEWKVLQALLTSGRTLSTNDLLEQVWHDRYGDPRQVWAVIGRLRLKIEPDPRHPRYVRHNRSFGYWLAVPCHERDEG